MVVIKDVVHVQLGLGSFFFSSRRRHTRLQGDWSSDVCSSDLVFERDESCQLFNGTGHCRERLANFMCNRRGQPAKRGHSFLNGNFLFKPAKVSEVLKVENVAIPFGVTRSKRRSEERRVERV